MRGGERQWIDAGHRRCLRDHCGNHKERRQPELLVKRSRKLLDQARSIIPSRYWGPLLLGRIRAMPLFDLDRGASAFTIWTEASMFIRMTVPTGPSTNPVDQPIDLLPIRPAH